MLHAPSDTGGAGLLEFGDEGGLGGGVAMGEVQGVSPVGFRQGGGFEERLVGVARVESLRFEETHGLHQQVAGMLIEQA